jgi:hypothetical protein
MLYAVGWVGEGWVGRLRKEGAKGGMAEGRREVGGGDGEGDYELFWGNIASLRSGLIT